MNAATEREFTVYYARVTEEHAERAMDLLKDSNVIGTVLNKSSQRNLHTYYYKS